MLPDFPYAQLYGFTGLNSEDPTQHQEGGQGPILRSALQGRRTLSKHASDEADSQPQAKKKKIDLIFKDVLEASLEANQCQDNPLNSTLSLPRTRRQVCFNQSNSLSYHVTESVPGQIEGKVPLLASGLAPVKQLEGIVDERYIKMEEAEEEPTMSKDGPSTSFCPNCVRLKRRIRELEAELLRYKQQEQTEPLVSSEPLPSDDLRGRFPTGRELCCGMMQCFLRSLLILYSHVKVFICLNCYFIFN